MLIQLEIKLSIRSNWKSSLAKILVENQTTQRNDKINIIEYFFCRYFNFRNINLEKVEKQNSVKIWKGSRIRTKENEVSGRVKVNSL